MNYWKRAPLRHKQTLVIMGTTAVALLLACVGFFVSDYYTIRQGMVRQLTALALVLNDSAAAALEFDDPTAARKVFAALTAEPDIVAASLFTRSGAVHSVHPVGTKTTAMTALPTEAQAEFRADRLVLVNPIATDHETVGAIRIESNLDVLAERQRQYVVLTAGVLLISLLVALGLSTILQRVVSQPILELAAVARRLAGEKNYSVRVAKTSEDELGGLMEDFNGMLEQIQARDNALQQARDELEQRVQDRTRDLQAEVRERERAEEALRRNSDRLEKINTCLLQFTTDHAANIQRLTQLCGQLLGATCALYNRLEDNLLCTTGRWQAPPDLKTRDTATGHICFDVIRQDVGEAVFVPNLPATAYAVSDPNVTAYGLRTYLGHVVRCERKPVGSLCVVYQTDFEPAEDDRRVLGILASAIGNEDQRRLAEEELHRSQERLRASIESTPNVAVQWYDEAGRVLFWNPASERIYGWPKAEAMGRSVGEFLLSPEDASQFVNALQSIRSTGKSVGPVEFRIRRRNGTDGVCLSTIFEIPGSGGSACFVCMDVDVTEQKQAEAALTQTAAELSAVYEHAPAMMFLLDERGQVRRANRTALEYSNCGAPEHGNVGPGCLLNCAFLDQYSGRCNESTHCACCEIRELVNDLFRTGRGRRRVEVRLQVRRDGSEQDAVLLASTARMEISKQTMALLCLEDVSDRRRLEEQLRQAQKMEALGQLAGGVAHDFNNILTAILIQLDLLALKKTTPPPEVSAGLREIGESANRAANLIRQLLVFSRQQIISRELLDLNDLIANMLKLLRRLLGEHVQFAFQTSPQPVWVEADAGMMEQVIVNLCVNARDALMPKGGRLDISVATVAVEPGPTSHPAARAGRFQCITVHDTGCGMSPATMKRIFEPFFTTKEVGRGTGLGLATVYGIVKQHEGWIEVESELGLGTTFRVYYPAREASQKKAPSVVVASQQGGDETLLVVEDDPVVSKIVVESLERLGYRVHSTTNGPDARRIWRQHPDEIRLLLTDMVLPDGMSGLELAGILRAEEPKLKVIISSGYSLELVGIGLETESRMATLPKPYQLGTLASLVRKCLDQP